LEKQDNPYAHAFDGAQATLTSVTIALAVIAAVVLVLFLGLGVRIKKNEVAQVVPENSVPTTKSQASDDGAHTDAPFPSCACWPRLDLLFSAKHPTPNGSHVRVFQTSLGGVFTVMALLLVAVLGIIVALQNLLIPTQTSSISTLSLPFEPTGTYQLKVTVFGNGLNWANECMNGSLFSVAPTAASTSDWVGVADIVPNTYAATDNSCTLTWRCSLCSMASNFVQPSFALSSSFYSWANYITYTFTTPSLMTSLALVDTGPVYTVTQSIFPSKTKPLDSWTALRRNAVLPGMNENLAVSIMLTGFVVNATLSGTVRATYQPSVSNNDFSGVNSVPWDGTSLTSYWIADTIALANKLPLGLTTAIPGMGVFTNIMWGGCYTLVGSPAAPQTTSPSCKGFQINFKIIRNSVNVVTYVEYFQAIYT
jgi:hypothetical protein